MVDAIASLRQDHEKLHLLAEDLERATSTAARRDLLAKIRIEALRHAYVEEEVFYPLAREAVPDRDDIFTCVRDHDAMTQLLADLSQAVMDDRSLRAKTQLFIECLHRHAWTEEHECFPRVQQALGHKQLADLTPWLTAAKRDVPDSTQ